MPDGAWGIAISVATLAAILIACLTTGLIHAWQHLSPDWVGDGIGRGIVLFAIALGVLIAMRCGVHFAF